MLATVKKNAWIPIDVQRERSHPPLVVVWVGCETDVDAVEGGTAVDEDDAATSPGIVFRRGDSLETLMDLLLVRPPG